MTFEAPPARIRTNIIETAQGLCVRIKTKRNFMLMAFLPLWLMGWMIDALIGIILLKSFPRGLRAEARRILPIFKIA